MKKQILYLFLLFFSALPAKMLAQHKTLLWSGKVFQKTLEAVKDEMPSRSSNLILLYSGKNQKDSLTAEACRMLLLEQKLKVKEYKLEELDEINFASSDVLMILVPSYGRVKYGGAFFLGEKENPLQAAYLQEQFCQTEDRSSIFVLNEGAGLWWDHQAGTALKQIASGTSNAVFLYSPTHCSYESLEIPKSVLVQKGAIDEKDVKSISVRRRVSELPFRNHTDTPLEAFIRLKQALANGSVSEHPKDYFIASKASQWSNDGRGAAESGMDRSQLKTKVLEVLVYKNRVAGIVNEMFDGVVSLWFMKREKGKWMAVEETFGGKNSDDAKLLFRERAKEIRSL